MAVVVVEDGDVTIGAADIGRGCMAGLRNGQGLAVVGDGLSDGGVEELPRRDGRAALGGDGGDHGQDVVFPARTVAAPGGEAAERRGQARLAGGVEADRVRGLGQQLTEPYDYTPSEEPRVLIAFSPVGGPSKDGVYTVRRECGEGAVKAGKAVEVGADPLDHDGDGRKGGAKPAKATDAEA